MEAALEAEEVVVEFLERTDGTVYVGYQTHLTDVTRLTTELEAVVTTILERAPGTAVEGVTLHTQRPVLATWRVDRDWAAGYEDGSLPAAALVTKVLGSLETASFQ